MFSHNPTLSSNATLVSDNLLSNIDDSLDVAAISSKIVDSVAGFI